jgi:hypothetical protein
LISIRFMMHFLFRVPGADRLAANMLRGLSARVIPY